MISLFKYELKKLLFNKFFIGLVIISAFYSHQIMYSDIILGISNTAPFSGWSYGEYLAKMLPILLVALLFFISFLYSKQEKHVQVLTNTTPINPFSFKMLRCITIIIAFILISLVPIIYSLWFYKVIFNFKDFQTFLLPMIITLLPAMLFVCGLGMIGGKIHESIVFILMIVVILISYLKLPYAIDLFGENFFKNFPLSLNIVEPTFSLPMTVILGKCIYSFIGVALILISSMPKKPTNH